MTSGESQEPSGTGGLQFDRAEFEAPAPGSVTCRVCARPVADVYYELQGQTLCTDCARGVDSAFVGGSRPARVVKAGAFGTAAAVGAAVLMYLFTAMTQWHSGIISVLAGYMVGSAVRQGSGYRGGRGYQVLALFLTYSAVSWSYLPLVYQQLVAPAIEKAGGGLPNGPGGDAREAAEIAAGPERKAEALPKARPADGRERGPLDPKQGKGVKAEARPKTFGQLAALLTQAGALFLLVVAVVVVIDYAAPILFAVYAFPQGLLLLLIYYFGLQQAWRLTRGVSIDIQGPFRVGQGGPSHG